MTPTEKAEYLDSRRRFQQGIAEIQAGRQPAARTHTPPVVSRPVNPEVIKAQAAARAAVRARAACIVNCDEAKGREKLALHLAVNTEMTPDAAKAILSVTRVAGILAAQAAATGRR